MRADNSERPSRSTARAKRSGAPKKTSRRKKPAIDAVVKHAQENVMDKLRPTVTDLVRLLELQSELKSSTPRKLTVKWIDRCAEPGSEE